MASSTSSNPAEHMADGGNTGGGGSNSPTQTQELGCPTHRQLSEAHDSVVRPVSNNPGEEVRSLRPTPSVLTSAAQGVQLDCANASLPTDVLLTENQYALYAAYYQWYYHAAQEARNSLLSDNMTNRTQLQEHPPDSKRDIVKKWMKRPARQQIDQNEASRYSHCEGGTEYNIWYGKYLTDRYNKPSYLDRETAPYKCNPKRDAGYTRANTDASGEHFFCIYYAKGGCCLGKNCRFRHSVPTADDEGHLEWSYDIFGRERFSTHKDDMDGVGSFNHDCKTLFVGGFCIDSEIPDGLKKMESFLLKEFSAWGDVTCIRVIPKKNIAFITYAYRVQAEFAKVAMADQNLGKQAPLLLVKWAHHDGNANKRRTDEEEEAKRKRQKELTEIGPSMPSADGVHPGAFPFLPEGSACRDAAGDAAAVSATLQGHYNTWQVLSADVPEKADSMSARFSQAAYLHGSFLQDWAALYDGCSEKDVDAAPRPLAEQMPKPNAESSGGGDPSASPLISTDEAEEALGRMQHILNRIDGLDATAFEVPMHSLSAPVYPQIS
ncbi:hypothetical protein BESB_048610 [Besnoitia besnoiti]|uniref:Pre-mRNA-splicing factor cwc2 n=1 Tax=Besnoitia besnoiti TaxID=94643 RepID=A0A2A9MFH5_BESBE|nr:hypothetical protein BESB_048610 [Besnoitia besnoiti]PFH36669.1 hypothetical protein BESB_048610 [Besnoitia besnoiti]